MMGWSKSTANEWLVSAATVLRLESWFIHSSRYNHRMSNTIVSGDIGTPYRSLSWLEQRPWCCEVAVHTYRSSLSWVLRIEFLVSSMHKQVDKTQEQHTRTPLSSLLLLSFLCSSTWHDGLIWLNWTACCDTSHQSWNCLLVSQNKEDTSSPYDIWRQRTCRIVEEVRVLWFRLSGCTTPLADDISIQTPNIQKQQLLLSIGKIYLSHFVRRARRQNFKKKKKLKES